MARKTLAPQQARSRESTRKLLKAAAEVLGQHGVEGATIPRIAEHAGLTPAMARQIPLSVFAEQLITSMLVSYRANAALLRALRQFAQGTDHATFYKKVTKLEMGTFKYL